MTDISALQSLIDDGSIVRVLRQGSDRSASIKILQEALYYLGFGGALKWDRFGPDGHYGEATTQAVQQFASRNGVASEGDKVGVKLGRLLVKRLEFLDEIHHMQDAIEDDKVLRQLYFKSDARIAITVLQNILHELGYDEEMNWSKYGADGEYGKGTKKAVKAFALAHGLASDGTSITREMARKSLETFIPYYGPGWYRESPGLIRESLTITETNKSVVVSDGRQQKEFRKFRLGLYTSGDQKTDQYIDANRAELLSLGMSDSALNVMIGVSENEGCLDAINTWDDAFMTFGMFQWTIGTGSAKGELPALLKKIKDADRHRFDTYFGRYGVDVAPGTNDTHGHLVLNGQVINSAARKLQFRQPDWCFRFWMAGQDAQVQAISIKHAFSRIGAFYRSPSFQVNGYDVADIVTSEYGIALVLDNHVNRPGYVKTCLAKAMNAAGLEGADPASWDTPDEQALLAKYLVIRKTHGQSPMTDAEKRALVTRKYLTSGIISDARGSFRI